MSILTGGLGSEFLLTGGLASSSSEFVSADETVDVLNIENVVSNIYDIVPLTGIYSPDYEMGGWFWDRRSLENRNRLETIYNTYLGGHRHGLKEGVIQSFWQSGSINGTEYLGLDYFKAGDHITWTPVVKTGNYGLFWDRMRLYSDFSFTTKIDPLLNEMGCHKIELREDCFDDTVTVVLYERDEELVKRPKYNFEFVNQFTGEIDESTSPSTRLSTVADDGSIIWDNIASRKQEFLIEEVEDGNNILRINGDYQIKVGDHDSPMTDKLVRGHYEDSGPGNTSGRLCFTKYFPVAKDSVQVIAVDVHNSFEILKRVENLNFSSSTDGHYTLDEDLGIISVGGYKAPDLVLASGISEIDTTIPFLPDYLNSSSYPDQGIITIGSEKILYYYKGAESFYDCVRGYANTLPKEHPAYSTISDVQHGKSYGDNVNFFLKYTAVPRIQYETTDADERTANKDSRSFVDVKPVKNATSNKIVQISSVETHVDSIVLETSADLIGGSLHGPVYYGTDFAELCATVYDSQGNPVEDIETTIVLDPTDIGALNGTQSTYTALTNSAGQICAIYNAPYDWDSVSAKIKTVSHSGSDTVMTFDERPPGVIPEDITVFQVLKHDPIIGTAGKKVTCIPGSGELAATFGDGTSLGFAAFDVEGFFDEPVDRFEGGFVDLLVTYVDAEGITQTIKHRKQISQVIPRYYTDGRIDGLKVVLNESCPHMDGATALSYAWLYEREAKEWNGTFLDGVRVVLYEWNEEVLNPNDLTKGAYYPLRPDTIQPTQMTFNNRHLPIPQPFNQDKNLGGYLAVIPDMVKFYAYARDPVSGRIITSNEIRIRLDLPAYLNGVDKSNPALPIPYGFSFITEDFNVGTGIGGANFLTINPKASGINSYNLFVTPTPRGH